MINLRLKITNELLNMGYTISNVGVIYLIDIIEILYYKQKNSNFLIINLEKDIYNLLIKKYNTNIHTIKSNIIKATCNMNNYQYLNNSSLTIKWTPKTVIQYILQKI